MTGQPAAQQIRSEQHFHNPDSDCLEQMPEIPTGEIREGKPVMVAADHWYRCTRLVTYQVHQHGAAFHAHETRDRCEFPR